MTMPARFISLIESAFAIGTGAFGSYVAVIRPWQEQIQWAAQMMLLIASITSVGLGIFVAIRALRKP